MATTGEPLARPGFRQRAVLGRQLGFGYGGEDGKQAIDLGHLEELKDAAVDSGDDKLPAVALAGNEVVDDGAHAGRIHVGHTGEIEDERGGGIGANCRLKIEEPVDGKGPVETQNAAASNLARDAFQRQRFGGHA